MAIVGQLIAASALISYQFVR